MINFLESASDEEWMYIACDVNYDEGLPLLTWMVAQSGCPQSAALAIYWLMSPASVKGSDSTVFDDDRAIINLIEKNYPQSYKVTDLGFDPVSDIFAEPLGYDWTSRAGISTNIPSILRQPLPGKKITHKDSRFTDWLECRPPSLLSD